MPRFVRDKKCGYNRSLLQTFLDCHNCIAEAISNNPTQTHDIQPTPNNILFANSKTEAVTDNPHAL
jgi:hypothetical protein